MQREGQFLQKPNLDRQDQWVNELREVYEPQQLTVPVSHEMWSIRRRGRTTNGGRTYATGEVSSEEGRKGNE